MADCEREIPKWVNKMAATGRLNVIGLYRCLLKQIRLLPQDAQLYYKNYVRQVLVNRRRLYITCGDVLRHLLAQE